MKPQTTVQILHCLTLGRYTARVVDGELRIQGPQPLAGPLPASIKARPDELIAFLDQRCGGTWPPAPGSEVHTPPTLRKSRDARVREWLQKPREERAREVRRKLREGAVYHRAIDLGVQGVVDSYLATRPSESRAWESYTTAHQEVAQSRGREPDRARADGSRLLL